MREISAFLKEKKQLLLYFVLSSGVLLLVYLLAGFPAYSLWYAAGLQGFILLLMLLFSYRRFAEKRRILRELKGALMDAEAALPPCDTPLEQQYQQLLTEARAQYMQLRHKEEQTKNDALSYYTLWVHQIKTPIAAMRLLLEDEGDIRSSIRQELFKVERYSDLALQYARMEGLLEDIVIEPCDLETLSKESVKKYAILFIHQKLSVSIEAFHETVMSDKKWVAFILEQLLSNAVKYTKTGGVTIRFQDGTLHVIDTGAGIRKEDLPRVFDKGYTGYNGRVDGRASGIGLYLTKRVCDALNIKITISSELGVGTDVALQFPQT